MGERPTNPLAGGGGILGVRLARLDDDELQEYIRYWEFRMEEHRADGDGYGGWWCSKLASAALIEQRERRLAKEQQTRREEDGDG